jgi:hypothetical protein
MAENGAEMQTSNASIFLKSKKLDARKPVPYIPGHRESSELLHLNIGRPTFFGIFGGGFLTDKIPGTPWKFRNFQKSINDTLK